MDGLSSVTDVSSSFSFLARVEDVVHEKCMCLILTTWTSTTIFSVSLQILDFILYEVYAALLVARYGMTLS